MPLSTKESDKDNSSKPRLQNMTIERVTKIEQPPLLPLIISIGRKVDFFVYKFLENCLIED